MWLSLYEWYVNQINSNHNILIASRLTRITGLEENKANSILSWMTTCQNYDISHSLMMLINRTICFNILKSFAGSIFCHSNAAQHPGSAPSGSPTEWSELHSRGSSPPQEVVPATHSPKRRTFRIFIWQIFFNFQLNPTHKNIYTYLSSCIIM